MQGKPTYEELEQRVRELEQNQLEYIQSIGQITEFKKQLAASLASEEKYRILVDKAEDAIFVVQDERIKFANLKSLELIGYSMEELYSKCWFEFAHPDDQPLIFERYTQRIKGIDTPSSYEFRFVKKSGETRWAKLSVGVIEWGEKAATLSVLSDITDRKQVEEDREKLIKQLQKALKEIKTLKGILPICYHCKKIRDDKGYWSQIESYIEDHSDADFSHSICPECAKKLYPDMDIYDD